MIVGEGPLRTELEARVAADRSQVRLLGHRDDIASLLAAADIALLTSTWEARALVAQEALLAGVPLVSTRVGGIEELVGDAAVLVEPGDLAAAVRELPRCSPPTRTGGREPPRGSRASIRPAGRRPGGRGPADACTRSWRPRSQQRARRMGSELGRASVDEAWREPEPARADGCSRGLIQARGAGRAGQDATRERPA